MGFGTNRLNNCARVPDSRVAVWPPIVESHPRGPPTACLPHSLYVINFNVFNLNLIFHLSYSSIEWLHLSLIRYLVLPAFNKVTFNVRFNIKTS
jgi:hypothetical protein